MFKRLKTWFQTKYTKIPTSRYIQLTDLEIRVSQLYWFSEWDLIMKPLSEYLNKGDKSVEYYREEVRSNLKNKQEKVYIEINEVKAENQKLKYELQTLKETIKIIR